MYRKCLWFYLLFVAIVFGSTMAHSAPFTTLSWDPNADAEYYVVYGKVGTSDYTPVLTTTTNAQTTVDLSTLMFQDALLKPGIPYTFTIKAFNSCGNSSDFSDAVLYTIPVPTTIANLALNKTSLNWTYTGTDVAVSHRITYTSATGPKTITIPRGTTTYDLCSISFDVNVPYTLTVATLNDSGIWGSESNSVTYTRRSLLKPSGVKIGATPR